MIEKEVDDLLLAEPCEPLRLYAADGAEKEIWDGYAEHLPHGPVIAPRRTGWTSWYSLYTNISEKSILSHLDAVIQSGLPLDVFQIDDGYQRSLGEWLIPNAGFPSGMAGIARKIREGGFIPGLWLAPFVCERKSFIFRNFPDWLLRDREGRPVRAGWNHHWSGFFYALDPDVPGVKNYLREVFRIVFDEWGFGMVKLDFLYAACLLPKAQKSRGRIMSEAMDFLRELAGGHLILGCGVPLGSAVGKVDYCRIGGDVSPFWEDSFLSWVRYDERVSTLSSLVSTLSRRQLSDRFFGNDPDVFYLQSGNNKLTSDQRYTLFLVNNILGKLLFFSDNPAGYDKEERQIFDSMYPLATPSVLELLCSGETAYISLRVGERLYAAYINLSGKAHKIDISADCFSPRAGYFPAGSTVTLPPYRSYCFLKLEKHRGAAALIGSSHVFPASDIVSFTIEDDRATVELSSGTPPSGELFIALSEGEDSLRVNGVVFSRSSVTGGRKVITVPYAEIPVRTGGGA